MSLTCCVCTVDAHTILGGYAVCMVHYVALLQGKEIGHLLAEREDVKQYLLAHKTSKTRQP